MINYKLKTSHDIREDYLFQLLKDRGVQNVASFLNPLISDTHDGMLLDNMLEGVSLLAKHMDQRNKTLIIVDCDTDGYTSSAMLYLALKSYYEDISHIEYKVHKGKQHGLEDFIDDILQSDYKFIILPDSSSNDYKYHEQLKEANIDCLVLDHHEALSYSKNAIVINNQLSLNYPNKALCGCGVVYKFLQIFEQEQELPHSSEQYLDLVAVALVSDMMDVTDQENRYLISYGLAHITNVGLATLVEKQSFSIGDITHITPTHISFYIAPLINALIRVGSEEDKLILFRALIEGELLIDTTKRASFGQETIAEQNARNCTNAKARQNKARDTALLQIEGQIEKDCLNDEQLLIINVDNYKNLDSTLTGLVAMQICAKYNKPTLIVRSSKNNTLKGSGRNANNSPLYDLKGFLNESNLVEYAEGHSSAFGVSISEKKLDKLLTYARENLSNMDFNTKVFEVDFIRDGKDKDIADIVEDVGSMPEIWGQKMDEPILLVKNIPIKECKIVLKGRGTLEITYNNMIYLKFFAEALYNEILTRPKDTLLIVGNCSINHWQGRSIPQVMIKDISISSFLDF